MSMPLSTICKPRGIERGQLDAILHHPARVTEVRAWIRKDSLSGLIVPEASVHFDDGAFSHVTFWHVHERDDFVQRMQSRIPTTEGNPQ